MTPKLEEALRTELDGQDLATERDALVQAVNQTRAGLQLALATLDLHIERFNGLVQAHVAARDAKKEE